MDKDFDRGFAPPVRVELDGPGKIRNVTSTREAAECLLWKWPSEGGRKHLAGRKACILVLEGLKKAMHARRAFEAAAREADILVEEDTRNVWDALAELERPSPPRTPRRPSRK